MKTTRHLLALWLALGLLAIGCKALVRSIAAYRDAWASGITKKEGTLDNGIQTGEWAFYYENGQRRANGRYDNDHQVGPWTYYYENGGVERAGPFDASGKRTGEWSYNYPDGTLRARGTYLGDFEDGSWEYFAPDGSIERSGQYDKGMLSGPWLYFHAGGRPKATGLCFRGERVGPWRICDEAGQERAQDFGLKTGLQIVREAWPNGTPARLGILQDGVPAGRWTSWHDNGKARFSCSFQNGRARGVFEARDATGAVIAQGVLQDGQFADGSFAVQNGQSRAIATGPLPAPAAEGTAAQEPEAIVARLVAEAGQPIAADAQLVQSGPAAPVPAGETVLAQLSLQPDRIAAAPQPDLTVTQREEMDDYVRNYLTGTSKSRVSRKKYGPATTDTRSRGAGERTELIGKPLPFQSLRCVDNTTVDLLQYRGKQDLLLVVLRGFSGEVCPYCIAQTRALAESKLKLDELAVEVLVIYPGPKENQEAFQKAYQMTFEGELPPYRVFYDPDLELVEQLGIAGELAFPTTLIVDRQGLVKYAYVGQHVADRPAAIKLLEIIGGMKK